MSEKKITKSPEYRWSERRADLAAELEYLDKRRAAVAELLNLVRVVENSQEKGNDGKK